MGKGYLIDSNVVIDYMSSLLPEKGSDFVENLLNTTFMVSVVVKIEVLGFADAPLKMQLMEELFGTAIILPLDDVVADKSILLRRMHKKLKLGDAIIAATALAHGLVLITRNVSDFKNIEGLETLDPWGL